MATKRSVGLLFFTEVRNEVVAVLQVRGRFTFDAEMNVRDGSWPGGCQVTCRGWVNEREDDFAALTREVQEKLGDTAVVLIHANRNNLKRLVEKKEGEEEVPTFGLFVADYKELLPYIRLGSESGGLRLIDVNTKILDLTTFDRKAGVPTQDTTAMLDHEIRAVANGFVLFGD